MPPHLLDRAQASLHLGTPSASPAILPPRCGCSPSYLIDLADAPLRSPGDTPMRSPMAEISFQVGFLEMLAVPLDREQRLDVLEAMARQAEWLSADDILLAAALLDHASRSRVDGQALTVEQIALI